MKRGEEDRPLNSPSNSCCVGSRPDVVELGPSAKTASFVGNDMEVVALVGPVDAAGVSSDPLGAARSSSGSPNKFRRHVSSRSLRICRLRYNGQRRRSGEDSYDLSMRTVMLEWLGSAAYIL